MNNGNREPEEILDQITQSVRAAQPEPDALKAAGDRVWARLAEKFEGQAQTVHSCEEFQAMIPGYLDQSLPEALRMLFHDHYHECVPCRKALETARNRGAANVVAMPVRRQSPLAEPVWRWAVAAMVLLSVGLVSWGVYRWGGFAGHSAPVTVAALDGPMFLLTAQGMAPVAAGQTIEAAGEIRTGRGGHAVLRLADGSQIEMTERSGLSLMESGRDVTVKFNEGGIIVAAAPRADGRLRVEAGDLGVSVQGTVFAVHRGVKGARISVVHGEVLVAQNRQEKRLGPGDQYRTAASVSAVSVEDDIAWSRNFDQYLAVLREMNVLGKQLAALQMPNVRYQSRMLDRLPADTLVFVALPNLGETVDEAHRLFEQRLQQNEALRQWWEERNQNRQGPSFQEMVSELRVGAQYLGDEIVIGLCGAADDQRYPLMIAEVRQQGFRQFVEAQVARMNSGENQVRVRLFDTVETLPAAASSELLMLVLPDLMVASPDPQLIRAAVARGGLAGAEFGRELLTAYRDGASFVFAVDLQKMAALDKKPVSGDPTGLKALGNVRYLIVEMNPKAGETDTHAVMTFAGQRQGFASWLGRPANIGPLEFVSPEANFVSAWTMKDPAIIVDELRNWISSNGKDPQQMFAKLEADTGIRIKEDVADSFGGNVAFAFDGPVLPKPAWIAALDVEDPARLQFAIRQAFQAAQREATAQGKPLPQLAEESAGGRHWFRIYGGGTDAQQEVHLLFADNYLVASSTRTVIEKALQNRAAGYTLPRSSKFVSLLPQDQYVSFSAVVYVDVASKLGSSLESLAGAKGLTEAQKQTIAQIANDSKPLLIAAYGGDDKITFASKASILQMGLANLAALQGPMGIARAARGASMGTTH